MTTASQHSTQRRSTQKQPTSPVRDVLEELFPTRATGSGLTAREEEIGGSLRLVARGRIAALPQPRTDFAPAALAELTASIQQLRAQGRGIAGTGILQPLLLRPAPAGDGYILVTGERRYRAAGEAGLEEVPAIVLEGSEEPDGSTLVLLQLIENMQRQDLSPLEEAEGIRALMQQQKLSYRDVARLLGKSRGYLTNRVGLLKMGRDVQEMVSLRKDTLPHAQIIDGVKEEKLRQDLIRSVVEGGASEREVRRRVQAHEQKVSLRKDTTSRGGEYSGQGQPTAEDTDSAPPGSSTRRSDPQRDAMQDALQPAAALLAEAARQLRELSLSPDYRRRIRRQLEELKRHMADIESALEP